MNFKAFVTGSHAYGKPDRESDIDLVVFVNEKELNQLESQADVKLQVDHDYAAEHGTVSLRFGKLNLLCCLTEEAFMIWWKGTRQLKMREGRVARNDAMAHFHELRVKAGMTNLSEAPKSGTRKSKPEFPPLPKGNHREEDIPF